VIPGGQYGAGDVTVWDRGTWEPSRGEDPASAIKDGELHFDLDGEKLKGRFVLVRTRPDRTGKEQWLMLHKRDEFAIPGWRPEEFPRSVKSGRTNDEVAADPDATWNSDLPPDKAETRLKNPSTSTKSRTSAGNSKGRKADEASPVQSEWDAPSEEELASLDSLADGGTWILQGRELELTNLNKVLFPGRADEAPLTKRDLVRYYTTIAPVMLPYLVGRPLNMNRFPNGVERPGFWHKDLPDYAPGWIQRWRNSRAKPGESETYAVLDSPAALAWMANYASIELHPWTSTIADVDEPTWAYIDIDPGSKTTFEELVLLAGLYRAGLDHLGVLSMPKVTGKRGIHVWVPIANGYSFTDTRTWVEKLSKAVGATVPELVSWTWQKSARRGLARLDYTQNAINKTLVAPYSVRAAGGGPVSVPVEWDELESGAVRGDTFTIRSVIERVNRLGDPFTRLLDHQQQLPEI
jgi:bifunctional non-homologous end joining protein LigD